MSFPSDSAFDLVFNSPQKTPEEYTDHQTRDSTLKGNYPLQDLAGLSRKNTRDTNYETSPYANNKSYLAKRPPTKEDIEKLKQLSGVYRNCFDKSKEKAVSKKSIIQPEKLAETPHTTNTKAGSSIEKDESANHIYARKSKVTSNSQHLHKEEVPRTHHERIKSAKQEHSIYKRKTGAHTHKPDHSKQKTQTSYKPEDQTPKKPMKRLFIPKDFESKESLTRRFKLLENLGEGGSSIVRKVVSRHDGKICALKSAKGNAENGNDCIRRELKYLRLVGAHPNIIKCYGIFESTTNVTVWHNSDPSDSEILQRYYFSEVGKEERPTTRKDCSRSNQNHSQNPQVHT